MHHFLGHVVLVAALFACTPLLEAQALDTARMNRAVARLRTKLQADASLPDSLRRLSASELVGSSNLDYAERLDDSSSTLLMQALAATWHQLPDSLCGSFLGATPVPAGELDVFLPYVDSTTLSRWALVIERVVHARARSVPPVRVASESEAGAAMLGIFGQLNVADRQRLFTITQTQTPSRDDACWAAQRLFDGLAARPATELGPVVRALFGQTQLQKKLQK